MIEESVNHSLNQAIFFCSFKVSRMINCIEKFRDTKLNDFKQRIEPASQNVSFSISKFVSFIT